MPSTISNVRANRRLVLTLAIGVICGFLSACLFLTAAGDRPHMLRWIPIPHGSGYRDPHHYSQLEHEVYNL